MKSYGIIMKTIFDHFKNIKNRLKCLRTKLTLSQKVSLGIILVGIVYFITLFGYRIYLQENYFQYIDADTDHGPDADWCLIYRVHSNDYKKGSKDTKSNMIQHWAEHKANKEVGRCFNIFMFAVIIYATIGFIYEYRENN